MSCRLSYYAGVGLAVATVAAWTSTFWGVALLSPDSATYLAGSWLVPLGYPIFLSSVEWITGTLLFVPPAQFLILGLAAVYLGYASLRLTGRSVSALAAIMAVLVYTPLFWAATHLVTDATMPMEHVRASIAT